MSIDSGFGRAGAREAEVAGRRVGRKQEAK
jgi:hypothetical protein